MPSAHSCHPGWVSVVSVGHQSGSSQNGAAIPRAIGRRTEERMLLFPAALAELTGALVIAMVVKTLKLWVHEWFKYKGVPRDRTSLGLLPK